jgi:hypothetical protein
MRAFQVAEALLAMPMIASGGTLSADGATLAPLSASAAPNLFLRQKSRLP